MGDKNSYGELSEKFLIGEAIDGVEEFQHDWCQHHGVVVNRRGI